MRVSSGRKFTKILGAELDKLVTLPLIGFILIGSFLLNLVLAAAFTSAGQQDSAGTQSMLELGLASLRYTQAGYIILGILAACSEYSGGQIRTTLTVIPWRGLQLSAKHLALAIITVPAAFMIAASGVLYSLFRMSNTAAGIDIGTMIKTLAGAAGYLTLTALLSAAIGSLLGRTTPAVVLLLGYYFVVSPLAGELLPGYLPDTAGYSMYMHPSAGEINARTPIEGTGILMLWTLLFITAALVLYRKRDA
ncbi:ABC transporter permease [Paenibacillus tengchongensis]|uniref:ABC transporter permease n=1 Tax=Paenibacillus tengchongensis TaxID=2608684 RepID=UPI00124C2521|nr:ABC transporter permease [Paenibacillus tengchongensis]